MNSIIFKEYDIRGIVGKDFFVEKTYTLTRAILTFVKSKHPGTSSIIIGNDGRVHSEAIKKEMTAACIDFGFDVIDIGLCPTPAVYFAAQTFNLPVALAITASHNPAEYNGIKMTGIWGKQIKEIQSIYEDLVRGEELFLPASRVDLNSTLRPAQGGPQDKLRLGSVIHHDIISDYISFLTNHFSHLKGKTINAVIDCGNGSAGSVIPRLVQAMDWNNVRLLFADVDGTFPNHEADPTVNENMVFVKQALANDSTLTLGIGFDGDADRMNPMTYDGYLVPGDRLLALFAQDIIIEHPGASVVFDIKSSQALIETLETINARPCIAPSGHSLIKEAISKHGALLAGELSCHFFFKDRYFGYDDGIYAALRLIELIDKTGKSLAQQLQPLPTKVSSPEFRIKCDSDATKDQIVAHVKNIFAARADTALITIDGVRAQMNYGWGLARASNTQPVISLRFESDTSQGLTLVKEDFIKALQPFFDAAALKDEFKRA